MSSPNRAGDNALFLAVTSALLVLSQQIAGKIIRDTLFLSLFSQRSLAEITVAAAVVALAAVPPFSHILSKYGPGRAVPAGFLTSALLYVVEFALFQKYPRPAVVLVYLHFAASGAALVSGFWSAVNERFDPRTARRSISRVIAAAAVGGGLGGVLGGVTARVPAAQLILGLAALQVGCAYLVWLLARGTPHRVRRPAPQDTAWPGSSVVTPERNEFRGAPTGFAALRSSPYLRDLALLAFAVTACQAILEYVFRVKAQSAFPHKEDLQAVIAIGHTVTSIGIFGLQALFSRRALDRLGVGGSVLSLPVTAAAGAGAAFIFPTLPAAGGAWVAEGVVHGSIFRSGYELFYAPLQPAEKRAAKSVIDVGFARLGDMAAGGLAWLAHMGMEERFTKPLLGAALFFAIASYWVGQRLQRGHVRALERSLVERAAEADIAIGEDAMTRTTVFDTMQLRREAMLGGGAGVPDPEPEGGAEFLGATSTAAPASDRGAALRSGNAAAARAVLQSEEPLTGDLVGLAIPFLADPALASDALLALRRVSARFVGQLTDALLDPTQDDAVRRRLPRVLSAEPTERAVDGLFRGLADRRFEVRYQCGLALSRIRGKAPDMEISESRVLAAISREVEADRSIWESRQALDRAPEATTSSVDRAVRERASQSLEHVFTLLSLILPRSNLAIAYQGLHVDDNMLRGTALEYLDAVLPQGLRETLWPFLSDEAPRKGPTRPKEEILADLNKLNESVVIRIDEIRALTSGGGPGTEPPSPAE